MLGFDVSERTISRWMRHAPRNPEPAKRWFAFLRNHREAIAAMDFFTVPTVTFSLLYCFFVIGHDRRRILHINVTRQLPWKPLSASEKAAIEGWQDQESGTGRRLMHMGDHVFTISSTTMNSQQTVPASGPTKVEPPTPEHPFVSTTPAIYVKTWDFGDSVVAIMLQPTWGGKPYWSSRVFANHNGFWKMEESYHTTVNAAPRMQYVPDQKWETSRAGN